MSEFAPYIKYIIGAIVALVVIVVFRDQLRDLFSRITGIQTKFFSVNFSGSLAKPEAQVTNVQKHLTETGVRPPEMALDFSKQTPRDAVFESWGSLKQIVYDFYKIKTGEYPSPPRILEVAHSLRDCGMITSDIYDIIVTLNNLGLQLEEDIRRTPDKNGALDYINKAAIVRVWLMTNLSVAPRPQPEPEAGEALEPPHRGTMVGALPQPGRCPIAVLEGVEGPLRGKRITVQNAHFCIGSNPDNDLVLATDAFVSRKHASLRHENGGLYLYDENSRNGTVLNGTRVEDHAAVCRGDRITIGQSVFKVSEAPESKSVNS